MTKQRKKQLYYSHSMQIYNTEEEKEEIALLKKIFPEHEIINPALYQEKWQFLGGYEIMQKCYEFVKKSSVIVFSAVKIDNKSYIGRGVFDEMELANNLKKEVYFINELKLTRDFEIGYNDKTDWTYKYGLVKCKNYKSKKRSLEELDER